MCRAFPVSGVLGMLFTIVVAAPGSQPLVGEGSFEQRRSPWQQTSGGYGHLPLAFEANQGQSDSRVKFLSRGGGHTLFLTASAEAVLVLNTRRPEAGTTSSRHASPAKERKPISSVVRMKLVGSNAAEVEGVEELPGRANYFIGNDPKKWRTDVPTYAKVKYHAAYRGVDLVYYGNASRLEFDFVVAPGADPSAIRLRLEGARKLSLDGQGNLVLPAGNGEILFQKPFIYQNVDGVRKQVAGGYTLKGRHDVAFQLAAYDVTKPLVIDPTLAYSTYLGGSSSDSGVGTVDALGNAYVTGLTSSTDFPITAGAYQTASSGLYHAFVAKLNPAGSAFVYSTYLGGGDFDLGSGIAVDSTGLAYVTGLTYSSDFPTVSPIQGANGGNADAFVTKLNATGSALIYSTYLGGGLFEAARSIVLDSMGSAYMAGVSQSSNFPTTVGAFQPANASSGGCWDAFVAKIDAGGSALTYSTYLGGSNCDEAAGIATDSAGSVYVTGFTYSTDFPTTTEAFQTTPAGFGDAFVTKVNAAGNGLDYSTYLGGSVFTEGRHVAVDAAGSAYVTGGTCSTDFPTTIGALQSANASADCRDGFVTKLNAAGSGLVYSTYLGGGGEDVGLGITVDSLGSAYVTGFTSSTDFPTLSPFQGALGGDGSPCSPFGDPQLCPDDFVAKLNPAGSDLVYSTYLGGSSSDAGSSIAVDSAGSAYVTGATCSTDFPTVNPVQAALGGSCDLFVAKIIVQTPSQGIQNLIAQVIALNLKGGIANSLDAKLDAALRALEDANQKNSVAAINSLQALINAVEAQRGIHISNADADALITAAQQIIALLAGN